MEKEAAAGLATAVRVQEENREIRERNQALAKGIAQVQVESVLKNTETICKLEKELVFRVEQKANAQGKKTLEIPIESLMKELNFRIIRKKVKNNGTILLGVNYSATNNLFLGNTPAVVDGTVRLVLKRCGTYIGEAFLSLPYDGS